MEDSSSHVNTIRAMLPYLPESIAPKDVIRRTGIAKGTVYATLSRLREGGWAGKTEAGGYYRKRKDDAGSMHEGQGARSNGSAPKPDPKGDNGPAVVEYPVAPHGHGAGETGRDNSNAERLPPMKMPAVLMRRWTGGRVPIKGFWTFAAGNSMEPYIPEGTPVFVEENNGPLVDGARYAFWLGDAEEDVIKRVALGPKKSVTLYGDNPAVKPRTLTPTKDPDVWRDGNGGTIRLRVQGRVVLPLDTAPAFIGQLAEFARSIIRP